MSVKEIKAEELRQKGGEEGIVFQGCGGDVKDWVDGVNQLLQDEKILLDGTKLTECYVKLQNKNTVRKLKTYRPLRYTAVGDIYSRFQIYVPLLTPATKNCT